MCLVYRLLAWLVPSNYPTRQASPQTSAVDVRNEDPTLLRVPPSTKPVSLRRLACLLAAINEASLAP